MIRKISIISKNWMSWGDYFSFIIYITLYFLHLFTIFTIFNTIFMLYFDKRKQFCAVVRNYHLTLLRDICPNSLVLSDREDW